MRLCSIATLSARMAPHPSPTVAVSLFLLSASNSQASELREFSRWSVQTSMHTVQISCLSPRGGRSDRCCHCATHTLTRAALEEVSVCCTAATSMDGGMSSGGNGICRRLHQHRPTRLSRGTPATPLASVRESNTCIGGKSSGMSTPCLLPTSLRAGHQFHLIFEDRHCVQG